MPVNPTYPGVYIEELPSPIRTITGVSTSVTAFIGIAKKGPVDEPTSVYNYSEYEREFGGLWKKSHMSYSVYHYFLNGGREALIVRVSDQENLGEFKTDSSGVNLEFRASSQGTWCKDIIIKTDSVDLSDKTRFNIYVHPKEEDPAVERFLNLSHESTDERYAFDIINNQSKFITIPDLPSFLNPPENTEFKYVDQSASDDSSLTSNMILGRVVENGVLESKPKRGLWALEKADIFNLMCIPTFDLKLIELKDVYEEAEAFCELRRAMLIMDSPLEWIFPEDPYSDTNKLLIQKENAAIFFPRFEANDLADIYKKPKVFAPSGAIAGVFARTDSTRGIWKAPAGIEANISGLNKLVVKLTDDENGKLNLRGINCLRSFPDIGTVIWGARTMRGADVLADQWKYIPVRRMALYIEESLYRGLQWVVFEPNDAPLWGQIRLNVRAFMHGLFRQGAFQGTKPSQAYLVKCDNETTTPTDVDKGVVNIIVGFAPLKPAEFVIIKIQQLAGQEAV